MGSFALQVLLVEDNPVNQRLMQRVLGKLGCHWTMADNGRIAVEELARRDYDVVLMDLHIPVMDGPMAIEHIRRGESGEKMREVWIIALTADAREEQRLRVLAAGANDYLTKPLKPAELAEAFHRLLAARGLGNADNREGAEP
jgi:CheY-like chemotaxis protein